MLDSIRQHYVEPIRRFNRSARLFLLMIVIDGVIYSGWQLFFNIYVLQNGLSREFLGLVNSMPSAAGLILGIPLGRLSDRLGRRSSIILGIAISGLGMLGQIMLRDPKLIAAAAFLYGMGNSLFVVSQAPLMAKVSDEGNRTMLFSLSFGLQTLAGAVGALFSGQLPALFGQLLSVPADNAGAYRAVLVTTILLGMTSIIPMWLMSEPTATVGVLPVNGAADLPGDVPPAEAYRKRTRTILALTVKLTIPQILIGFGAAILIPYMNVFFKDRFSISDADLGLLFGISSLLVGIGSMLAPHLSTRMGGKIRAVVSTQLSSLAFLLLIGFAPVLWISSVGYLLRTALMNMAAPLYSAYCMERTPEENRGLVNSVLNLSWSLGWSVGPFISGIVQEHYGFTPLFLATALLYGIASTLIWLFFKGTEQPQILRQTAVRTAEYPD